MNETTKDDPIKLNQKWRICGTTEYLDDCCVHANSDRELAMTEKIWTMNQVNNKYVIGRVNKVLLLKWSRKKKTKTATKFSTMVMTYFPFYLSMSNLLNYFRLNSILTFLCFIVVQTCEKCRQSANVNENIANGQRWWL